MSQRDKVDPYWMIGTILMLFGALVAGWNWYKAGVQQEVYRRQGVEMSRWEILMGAKPVERPVPQLK